MKRKKENNINKSLISQFQFLFLPIIIVSKILRYTILHDKLVVNSIGWRLIRNLLRFGPPDLAITGLSNMTNGASVATTNSEWMFHYFTLGIIEKIFSNNIWTCYVAFEVVITIVFDIFIFIKTLDYLKKNKVTQTNLMFILLNLAILNIFCLNPAKEPLQLVFFFLMAYAIKIGRNYRNKMELTLGVIMLSVFLVRKYYILVFIFLFMLYFFANFLQTEKKKLKKDMIESKKAFFYVLVLLMACGLVYFIMLSTLLKSNTEIYEELVFANTRMGPADSQILPIFEGQSKFLLTVDYLIKIFRLIFPIELFFHFKPTYLLAIIYQGMVGYFLFKSVKNWKILSDSTRVAYLLYFAFILCSAAFEPDFGSWIRHQGVAYPVILLLMENREAEPVDDAPNPRRRKMLRPHNV